MLAEARLVQERELRRAEVAKKRPTWMVAVTVVATLAAFVLVYVAIEGQRTTDEAQTRAALAMAQQREMKQELEQLTRDLQGLETELDVLAGKTDRALEELQVAETAAQVAEAKAKLDKLRAQEQEIRRIKREKEQRQRDKERVTPIKIDKKCLTNAIC
jgi:hypothetical protein